MKMSSLLKFLYYLRKNRDRKVKAKEILTFLKLKNKKSIWVYIKQLNSFNINIDSFSGYNGGYQIKESHLSKDEIIFIKELLPNDLFEKIKEINERLL